MHTCPWLGPGIFVENRKGAAAERPGLPSTNWLVQEPGSNTLAQNKLFQQLQQPGEHSRAFPLSPRLCVCPMLPSLPLSLASTHLSGVRQSTPPVSEQSEAAKKKKHNSHSFT